jgi:ABC-2 type transport system permease protein
MNTRELFRLLLWVTGRMLLRRTMALRQQSTLMLTVIALFVLAYGVGGYFSFLWGFEHLSRFPGLGGVLIERVLYVFFAFLLLMLVISNMVIGYSALFKSSETQWLLTLPVRAADVFAWKTAETTVLASWAFLFLATPLMLAYGAAQEMPFSFYLRIALLFIPFIIIPGAVGGLIVLFVTRYLHRRLFKWSLMAIGVVALLGATFFLRPLESADNESVQMMETVNQLLRGSRLALQPLLPSYWVAAGVVAWGE